MVLLLKIYLPSAIQLIDQNTIRVFVTVAQLHLNEIINDKEDNKQVQKGRKICLTDNNTH